jgi:hypothetical protein
VERLSSCCCGLRHGYRLGAHSIRPRSGARRVAVVPPCRRVATAEVRYFQELVGLRV